MEAAPEQTTPRKRRWPSLLGAAGGVVGLGLGLGLGVRLFATSDWGHAFAERQVEALSLSGQTIEIDGLDGDLLGQFAIRSLTVRDADGVWLTSEDVRVDWSPWALLRRRVVIDVASLATLRVDRRPEIQSQPRSAERSGGAAIRGGALGRLDVGQLETGDALTGEPARFTLTASANYRPDAWQLAASLQPETSQGDRLEIDLGWSDGDALVGSADITATEGGLIAGLARLAPDQSLRAALRAEGTTDAWSIHGTADIAGELAATLNLSNGPGGLDGSGSIALGHHPLTADLAPRIGERVDISVREETGASQDQIVLSVTADRLDAAIRTASGARDEPVEITARLTDPAHVIGVDGVTAATLDLDVTTQASPGDWSITGAATLQNLVSQAGRIGLLAGPVSIDLSGDDPAINLQLDARRAALDGATGTLLGGSPSVSLAASLVEDGALVSVNAFSLSGAHIDLSGAGEFEPGANRLAADGRLAFRGVASGLLPFDVSSRWRARNAAGSGALRPRLELTGQATGLTELPPDIGAVLGDAVRFDLTAQPDADGGVTLSAARLDAAKLSADATGSLNRSGDITAQISATTATMNLGTTELQPARLDANVSGQVDAVGIDLALRGEGIRLAGQDITAPSVAFLGNLEGLETLSGRLGMAGQSAGAPIAVETDLTLSSEQLDLRAMTASAFGIDASGSARAPLANPAAMLADLTVSGTPTLETPLSRIAATVRLSDSTIRVDGEADLLAAGALNPGSLSFNVTGDRSTAELSARFDSALDIENRTLPLSVSVDGQAGGLDTALTRLTLEPRVTLADLETTVIDPFEIERDASSGRLTAAGALGLLRGTTAISFENQPDASRLDINLDGLALAPVLALLDRPVIGGAMSGSLTVSQGPGPVAPSIIASGQITGLAPAAAPEDTLTLIYGLDARPDQFEAVLMASGEDALDLSANMSGPLEQQSAWPGLALPAAASANFAITGGGQIDTLTALLLPASINASGTVDLDLAGRFPSMVGSTRGDVVLRRGRVEQGDLGLVLDDILADIQIADGALTLARLSGTDTREGTLTGSGVYSFQSGANSADTTLQLTADSLAIVDRDDVSARGSGTLTLEETRDGFALTGALTVDRADIDPTQFARAGYTTLDVTFSDAAEGGNGTTEDRVRLALNIDLSAPRRIFVTGPGLDAELSILAEITGPAGDPRIDGQAEIVRGRFDFAGKRFDFEDSVIRLEGDPTEAELDLTAVRQASDIRAIIRVAGTPVAPEITLSSEPELPEDEVLSRVLFGRSATELSDLEALQLAASLASLSGRGGGLDIMSGIEDALGLDAIDLSRSEDGRTDVTTGKYLSEDVYLQVRTNGIGQPTLVIEWTPRENIEIEADLTPTEGQGAAIEWQREFD